MPTIASVTPTLCRLMGVEPPNVCSAPALEEVLMAAQAKVQRVLVYAADAIGRVFLDNRPELKRRLVAASDVQVELRSMTPPKTPVCFASMFTGAPPEVHGIRKYERPVLTCDTLFDALARRDMTEMSDISDRVPTRAGKRVAIVAVRDCSMDIIFRNRPIDYFTEDNDAEVVERTLLLLKDDQYDFIVAYNQEYDDTLHRTRHDGPEALAAAKRHVDTFVHLWQATEEHWAGCNRALLFTPDHGAHFDAAKGTSDHGEDIPEDMDVLHFWRLGSAAPADARERARRSRNETAATARPYSPS
jgi:hypothetical protein